MVNPTLVAIGELTTNLMRCLFVGNPRTKPPKDSYMGRQLSTNSDANLRDPVCYALALAGLYNFTT